MSETPPGKAPVGGTGTEPRPATKPPPRGRRIVAIAVPVLIVAALVAVFISRDKEPAATGEDPLIQYCNTATERDALELPDVGQAASEEVKNAVPVVAARLILLSEKMLEVAPDDSKPELRSQIAAYRELVRTRDAAGFRSAELLDSLNKSAAADASTCKMQKVEFAASQFSYRGFPDELRMGRASLSMKNESNEKHQMILFRRKPEFAGSFSEVLERGKQNEEATRVASGEADPDQTDVMSVELLNGDYALTCFIKAGPDEHWKKGEIAEFNVH